MDLESVVAKHSSKLKVAVARSTTLDGEIPTLSFVAGCFVRDAVAVGHRACR